MQPQDSLHPLRVGDFFPPAAIIRDGNFAALDEVDTTTPGSLVYCQNLHYVKKAVANPQISVIICSAALAGEVADSKKAVIAADDPRREFFDLYLRLKAEEKLLPLMDFGIGEGCQIHPSAVISPKAFLGKRVTVGAHAVIEDYCSIGDDVVIGQHVVVGAEGLLTMRRQDGSLVFVSHAGGVEIGQGCHILAGAVIAKSFFRRFTHIGQHSQIGIMTNIGHGAFIGEQCVISGNSVIAGRARIADRVWVGTSASVAQGLSVGEGAQIKMGSVVVGDIAPHAVVSGNFAVNHRVSMMRYLKGTI
ncbi:UDP-3-O-[3-hydroxymyristoyl] glucosamine N-acyltransferase [Pseudomonas guariconensis]|uniref:DapH/DapD/GlmU-related protein n=1 Tax=Pseudomonas guariconensis TaxID=1288410 RepID=UPI00087EF348|nr:DapH/DapD/GlmU-related protein [Pseudomonas guariconensis]SDC54270.1 UDP-3-O-[3-hydroxymyristoyl] glucosamine N-acyltransferase [Pseudomonas guariconensis]